MALIEGLLGFGYVGIFLFALLLNMIPFASPSNMVVAGATAALLPSINPLFLGFLIASASSLAKGVHFYVLFFARGVLNDRRRQQLEVYGRKIERWGILAAFVAAASPLPDDPIVVPLGLMRYNPIKFFLGFFSGKIIVTTAGAYIGRTAGLTLEKYFGNIITVLASVGLTLIITAILIRERRRGKGAEP